MSKVLYENDRIKLVEETRPEGQVRVHLNKSDSCLIIAHDRASFLTVTVDRLLLGRSSVELPGGAIEEGEPPEQAAARELTEETGYRGTNFVYVGSFAPLPSICTEICHIYSCDVDFDVKPGETDGEISSCEIHRIDDAVAVVASMRSSADIAALSSFIFSKRSS